MADDQTDDSDGEPGSRADPTARAMDALRRVVSALRGSSRTAVREAGVTGAQLYVLKQIAAAPGQSVNDIAARTLTRQNSVSEVIGRLVRRGLVTRSAARDDARRAVLGLTPAGQGALRRAPATLQGELAAAFRRLPEPQQRALAEGLEAWLSAANLAELPPTMFFEARRSGRGGANGGAGRGSDAR